jgi:UDP-N-acetylglucosamine/UDP-N-acetylgalactosamine diphosphorylase
MVILNNRMNRQFDDLSQEDRDLIERVHQEDQDHVFRWWDGLSNSSRRKLLKQLRSIDFVQLKRLRQRIETFHEPEPLGRIDPPNVIPLPEDPESSQSAERARSIGEKLLRNSKVAAVLVAGGQGTRLGFEGPKGAFPIGPVTGKTLFQWHAEKILARNRQYGVTIPWFIMTSETNDAETRTLFEQDDYYGHDPQDIFFFKQRMMPALDDKGKFLLDAKDHFFESPNGHGGCLLALEESGATARMKERGIEVISYFQVDNVLINPVDPLFLGYHTEAGAQMSSKMVRKTDPAEKVGLFCLSEGQLKVVEYSELTVEDANRRKPDGSLLYDAGSIAIHAIEVDFVETEVRGGFKLPYHVAHKKIAYLDKQGRMQQPSAPNGFKFETFIFDAILDTTQSVIMEISRKEEYSPVKNATGENSPDTARRDLSNHFGRWMEQAGLDVPRNAEGDVDGLIEISPLYAADQEQFMKKCPDDLRFSEKIYLGP